MSKPYDEKVAERKRIKKVVDLVCPECGRRLVYPVYEESNLSEIKVDIFICKMCTRGYRVIYEPTKIEAV